MTPKAASFRSAAAAPAIEPLPEGNAGLAAKYPDDRGLARDPAVIHFDDFEDYATPEDVNKKYEYVMRTENMRLTREPVEVNSGREAQKAGVLRALLQACQQLVTQWKDEATHESASQPT